MEKLFGPEHTALLDEALYVAEHTCADHFKLGAEGWKRMRFDLSTGTALGRPGAGAQVALAKLARYEAAPLLPSSARSFYRIFLQDGPIIDVAHRDGLGLRGLLTYVLTHELVHIVRFNRFEQLFAAPTRERALEERRVHQLTYDILGPLRRPAAELGPVLERFRGLREGRLALEHCWT